MHSGAGIGEKNNISVKCMNILKRVFLRILELAQLLLPLATDALLEAGLDETECSRLMGIIADRIQLRLNGAFWQKSQTRLLLEKGSSPTEAFNLMLNQYRNQFYSEKPLSQWEYLK